MKTKDHLKIGHTNKMLFKENRIRLEDYQEAFKYMEKLNKDIQHSIKIPHTGETNSLDRFG